MKIGCLYDKKLILLSILLILFAFVVALYFSPYIYSNLDIKLSVDASKLINIKNCLWKNDGTKYKCNYENISNHVLSRGTLKATAYDNKKNVLGTILFPKYHNIPPGSATRESLVQVNSRYDVLFIYIEANKP